MQRILVIDDDPEMRAMIEQTLVSGGYEVACAADGKEGLELHRAKPVNLVITDIFMPVMEGFEVVREFRKEFPNVALIAISGKPDAPEFLAVAKRWGAVRTLLKPFLARQLLETVKEVLAMPS
jgi:CheY-like chemotaxis protein